MGFEQEFPETVGRAGEVMPYLSRPEARIDPHEEDCAAWLYEVREPR